jgi:phosphoglycolate phosphatase-like HAD superfamily hydrolase
VYSNREGSKGLCDGMYAILLFDIDGVMLSEDRYFDASALTVHELLCSSRWLGLKASPLPDFAPDPPEPHIREIRRVVFDDDRVLNCMKSAGVNANWDMVYLQFMFQWLMILQQCKRDDAHWGNVRQKLIQPWDDQVLSEVGVILADSAISPHFTHFGDFVREFASCTDRHAMFEHVRRTWAELLEQDVHHSGLAANLRLAYDIVVNTFQEWYLGDAETGEATGKLGFVNQEVPLVEPDAFANLLSAFVRRGVVLGIATGRPRRETELPLSALGWSRFFDSNRVTTATEVRQAEKRWPALRPLSKPNPFSYLRSWAGAAHEQDILNYDLPLPEHIAKQILIIGDSVADWQAARAIGCDFAAVLTGLTGQAARPEFERLGCTYIFDNVLELGALLS